MICITSAGLLDSAGASAIAEANEFSAFGLSGYKVHGASVSA
jgi:hypothetical protein